MLRKIIWGFMFIAIMTVLLPGTARVAWAQTGGIEGDVKGIDGQPLVGVEVQIDRTDIKQHFQTKTDKKGHYFHAGLPSGMYRLSLWQDGKQITYHDSVRVSVGEPTRHDIDIKADQEALQKSMPKEVKEQQEKIEKEKKKIGDMKKHYDDGNTLFASKQFEQALAEFKTASEMDPSQYVIFARIAETEEQLKQYDEAITNYQKAITTLEPQAEQKADLKQTLADYYNNFGGMLAKGGKPKDAMEAYKKAVALFPAKAGMYYFNLGVVLTNSRAPLEDRLGAFKQAIDADPNNANAYFLYGQTLSEKMTFAPDGKISAPPEMFVALNKYLELEPQGKYAQGAKDLMAATGQTVQTSYGTKKEPKKPKK
ncbi:MAG: carboxypeptidase regulatory-like domain-containing protein [Acidobacteriia bacterium]|nr:carboxypeptidase regulatory-like domain-containing protein [Terriglobia bacterium]